MKSTVFHSDPHASARIQTGTFDTENKSTPTHNAYTVRDYGNDKSSWHETGAAWAHKDGKGYDIVLEALPVTGRIVLRVNEPKPKTED